MRYLKANRANPLEIALILAVVALAGGCASVPVYEQERVSQPGMTFSDSLVEETRISLISQIEPGSESSGGAQASGCTACR